MNPFHVISNCEVSDNYDTDICPDLIAVPTAIDSINCYC